MKRTAAAGVVMVVLLVTASLMLLNPSWRNEVMLRIRGKETIQSVLSRLGEDARARLSPHFESAGVTYPPGKLVLLAFKEERVLEVWAHGEDGPVLVREYPIVGASGGPGPKLREGDLQVPEGIYAIDALNPNSAFHLSLRVDYPNASDRQQAAADGRSNLGGDIFIHGGRASIGCLAMGDEAIEELFVLCAEAGLGNIEVIIAPCDLRAGRTFPGGLPVAWAEGLYRQIAAALEPFRREEQAGQ